MKMMNEPAHFAFNYRQTLEFYARTIGEATEAGPDQLHAVKKRLGETDLFFLLTMVLNRKDLFNEWLFDRCREVQRNPNGYLDLWAREHYKSTVITFGLTMLTIINDPNITIGIFSHTKSIARDFLRHLKTEMENNSNLWLLWPEIFYADPKKQSDRWSIDNGINVIRTENSKEATIEGHGLVDGMPTGRHFKGRIYDDVVTLESVSTPEQILKTTKAWQMSDNLGAEGGWERYIGTRYHLFDTYAAMLESKAVIPRLHPATIDGTEFGRPVLMKRKTLLKKRLVQGPYVFSSQMLLNPVADKAMGFIRDWIDLADVDFSVATSKLWRFILVDPAGSKQRVNNDYTTMWVLGHGEDKKYRVLDCVRDRLNLTGRTEALMELHRKWTPGLVAYEEYGMQADIEHINYVQKNELYEFHITPIGGNMPKSQRMQRLVPYFENGFLPLEKGGDGVARSRIIFPHNIPYIDYQGHMHNLVSDFIEDEYIAFPVLKHDDMMDNLSRIVDLEERGLIETPKVAPPEGVRHGLNTGLKNMGKSGEKKWVMV